MKKLYSNEIVFRSHPDKVADQISGKILDQCLLLDPNARVGVEVVGGKGKIFVTGEITMLPRLETLNIDNIVKSVLTDCGYDSATYEVINNLSAQSPDIAQGVDIGGAGDNGMMFGYACNDTPEMLPTAMVILQKFAMSYDGLRKIDARLKPDGKAQITGEYDDDFKLMKIKTFTICYQNTELDRKHTDMLLTGIARQIAREYGVEIDTFLVNPTGRFEIGGFEADAGLTGRKIVVDAYQSFANVGGGSLNGKDPSKVDLSGAHMARHLAKEFLREHNLRWCEVQLSYAIGKARPLAIYVNSDKGHIEIDELYYHMSKPKNIIKFLNLKNLCYEGLAKFGHFQS